MGRCKRSGIVLFLLIANFAVTSNFTTGSVGMKSRGLRDAAGNLLTRPGVAVGQVETHPPSINEHLLTVFGVKQRRTFGTSVGR